MTTLHLKMPSKIDNLSPRILVIGVGGAGGNIVNSMIKSEIKGVEFFHFNTDNQALKNSSESCNTLQLGPSCTKGLGAGADPEMGKKAAEEVSAEIEEHLIDSHMVFLTAGMGGGTGTGAAPIIASIAKKLNILTVGVVTKPFAMEGKKKQEHADYGTTELQKYVDNLIVIPNQNIFALAKQDTSFTDALQFANNVLIDGVRSIIDVMVNPGVMNHDFNDVKAIMNETGKVHLGTGIFEGEDRAAEATEQAISNPILENNSMAGAKGVLINITCGEDTSLHEIDLAVNRIRKEADENTTLILGVQKTSDYEGKFKISVLSTGIDSENYYQNIVNEEKTNYSTEKIKSNERTMVERSSEKIQDSFFVDLRQTSDFNKKNNSSIEDEITVIGENAKIDETEISEKKSFFGRLFGSSKNTNEDLNKSIPETIKTAGTENEFKNEIKEMVEESDKKFKSEPKDEIKDEENIIETSFSDFDSQSNQQSDISDLDSQNERQADIDDDLLQIPAFLRRQAN